MKSLYNFINEAGSTFSKEDTHYGMSQWKRWEKSHKKDYNIIFDDEIECYLIYTKSKGNNIGKHVGTFNSVDGILYYDPAEIKDIYD